MVIQHVSRNTAKGIVKNIVGLLKPDGILALITTNYPKPFYQSVCVGADLERDCDGEKFRVISEDQFEAETLKPAVSRAAGCMIFL